MTGYNGLVTLEQLRHLSLCQPNGLIFNSSTSEAISSITHFQPDGFIRLVQYDFTR